MNVDDRNQLHPIGKLADHQTVVVADDTSAYQGDPRSIGFSRTGLSLAHAYSIPSLFRMSVKAFQAWVNRSGPENAPVELVSPRCGSSEKKPSKPSARRARIVSTTSPSPAPATTTLPSASSASLIWI